MLAAVLCVTFYAFRSTTLIGDGLRHLPALRTITSHNGVTAFEPKPWLEIYRNHYDELVVHNHFLFGVTMRSAFALQHELGIRGDAIVAMQAVNTLCAAFAGALFFLFGLRCGLTSWSSLAVTFALCLSPVYLLAATNIAEVALPLPFYVGALLLFTNSHFSIWTPLAAGALAGLSAILYGVAASLMVGIAFAMMVARFLPGSRVRPLLLFLSSSGVVFAGIWAAVLIASGYHTVDRLLHAFLQFPQQGTFPTFKLSSVIANPVGLTQAFLSVLPDDFVGLRSLYSRTSWLAVYVGAATLIVTVLLAVLFYTVFKRGMFGNPLVLSCSIAFLLVEAACMKWDNYYQKLHLFAVLPLWVVVTIVLSKRRPGDARWPIFLFLGLMIVSGFGVLQKNIRPSQPRKNAEQLCSIIGDGLLITGWSSDVAQMWLYSNGDDIISLPDFALARNLKSDRVHTDLVAIIDHAKAEGRNVYFYGVFNESGAETTEVDESKFRSTGVAANLSAFRQRARQIANLPQPGGRSTSLYVYAP